MEPTDVLSGENGFLLDVSVKLVAERVFALIRKAGVFSGFPSACIASLLGNWKLNSRPSVSRSNMIVKVVDTIRESIHFFESTYPSDRIPQMVDRDHLRFPSVTVEGKAMTMRDCKRCSCDLHPSFGEYWISSLSQRRSQRVGICRSTVRLNLLLTSEAVPNKRIVNIFGPANRWLWNEAYIYKARHFLDDSSFQVNHWFIPSSNSNLLIFWSIRNIDPFIALASTTREKTSRNFFSCIWYCHTRSIEQAVKDRKSLNHTTILEKSKGLMSQIKRRDINFLNISNKPDTEYHSTRKKTASHISCQFCKSYRKSLLSLLKTSPGLVFARQCWESINEARRRR